MIILSKAGVMNLIGYQMHSFQIVTSMTLILLLCGISKNSGERSNRLRRSEDSTLYQDQRNDSIDNNKDSPSTSNINSETTQNFDDTMFASTTFDKRFSNLSYQTSDLSTKATILTSSTLERTVSDIFSSKITMLPITTAMTTDSITPSNTVTPMVDGEFYNDESGDEDGGKGNSKNNDEENEYWNNRKKYTGWRDKRRKWGNHTGRYPWWNRDRNRRKTVPVTAFRFGAAVGAIVGVASLIVIIGVVIFIVWICRRRSRSVTKETRNNVHKMNLYTSPSINSGGYIAVNDKPMEAETADAGYFVLDPSVTKYDKHRNRPLPDVVKRASSVYEEPERVYCEIMETDLDCEQTPGGSMIKNDSKDVDINKKNEIENKDSCSELLSSNLDYTGKTSTLPFLENDDYVDLT